MAEPGRSKCPKPTGSVQEVRWAPRGGTSGSVLTVIPLDAPFPVFHYGPLREIGSHPGPGDSLDQAYGRSGRPSWNGAPPSATEHELRNR